MIKKDTIWTIALLLFLFLIIHGMSNAGDPDKKTAQVAQDETTLGIVGATATFIGKKTIVWYIPLAIAGAIPVLWLLYKGTFFSPSIPIWAYIGGFMLLLVLLKKN